MHPDLDQWFRHAAYAPEPHVVKAAILERRRERMRVEDVMRERSRRPTVTPLEREQNKRVHHARRSRPAEQRRLEKIRAAEAEAHIRAVLATAEWPLAARDIFNSPHGTPVEERRFSRVALEQRLVTMAKKGALVLGPRVTRTKSSEGAGSVATYALPQE